MVGVEITPPPVVEHSLLKTLSSHSLKLICIQPVWGSVNSPLVVWDSQMKRKEPP